MKDRVDRLLGNDASGIWMGTFHNVAGRILRMYADVIGYTRDFVIYDEDDGLKVIKECLKELNIDSKMVQPKSVKGIISKAKEQLFTPDIFAMNIDKNNPMERHAARIYKLYQEKLIKANAMDFDDMISNVVTLFEKSAEALEHFRNKFKYILVDEYQDTNLSQYRMVSLLASHGNLCVVGDDDQSIYSFRGADIRNILGFEKEFKNCKVIKLEQNYRSTDNILSSANAVISQNSGRKQKKLWTSEKGGSKVFRFTGGNQNDESSFVAREILKLTNPETGEFSLNDIVVLYRTNSLSQNIETTLMRNSVPYKVYGGFKFFNRKEIKEVTNYLRIFQNLNDDQALKAIINVPPRKIGEKSIENASAIADNENKPLLSIISKAKNYTQLSRAAQAMQDFSDMFYNILLEKDDMGIAEFTKYVVKETGILDFYKNSEDEYERARAENIKEFINVATEFEKDAKENPDIDSSFNGFLEYLALSTDMDNDGTDDASFVRLMTIHASKGLEFPVVFVIGMEESVFPSALAEMEGNIEEERRLCYVAITRAAKRLYLTNAEERMTFGQTKYNLPCRFLKELPKDNYVNVDFRGNEVYEPQRQQTYGNSYNKYYGDSMYLNYGHKEDYEAIRTVKQGNQTFGRSMASKPTFGKAVTSVSDVERLKQAKLSAQSQGDVDFKEGDRIYHEKFGEGTILKINSEGRKKGEELVEIEFDGQPSIKRFALQYTKLKKI